MACFQEMWCFALRYSHGGLTCRLCVDATLRQLIWRASSLLAMPGGILLVYRSSEKSVLSPYRL